MRPSSSKSSSLIGGKAGASLAVASALLGGEGMTTFPVISVHSLEDVIPALPRREPPGLDGTDGPPSDAGLITGGVGGGTAGEVFLRTANAFVFKGAPLFSLHIQKLRQEEASKSASKKEKCLVDLLLSGNVKPSKIIVVF